MLVGLQIDAAALKNSMEVLKKKKIELPLDLAILLLGIYLKKKKKTNSKKYILPANKDILYSMWNSAQHSAADWMGGKCEGE